MDRPPYRVNSLPPVFLQPPPLLTSPPPPLSVPPPPSLPPPLSLPPPPSPPPPSSLPPTPLCTQIRYNCPTVLPACPAGYLSSFPLPPLHLPPPNFSVPPPTPFPKITKPFPKDSTLNNCDYGVSGLCVPKTLVIHQNQSDEHGPISEVKHSHILTCTSSYFINSSAPKPFNVCPNACVSLSAEHLHSNDRHRHSNHLQFLRISSNVSRNNADNERLQCKSLYEGKNTGGDDPNNRSIINSYTKQLDQDTEDNIGDGSEVEGTDQLRQVCEDFQHKMLLRDTAVRDELPPRSEEYLKYFQPDDMKVFDETEEANRARLQEESMYIQQEHARKMRHPRLLHPDIWYNVHQEVNGGPACRCGPSARRFGIHHDIFEGEQPPPKCDPYTNNIDKLFHYRITITPDTNLVHGSPTTITYKALDYIFMGFSLISHHKLGEVPPARVVQFKTVYNISCESMEPLRDFTARELWLFEKFLFSELLELLDFAQTRDGDACPQFHMMPLFVTVNQDKGRETMMTLPMCEVLKYLLRSHVPVSNTRDSDEPCRDRLVWNPDKKPSCIRCDLLDTCSLIHGHPTIVHFGKLPANVHPPHDEYRKKFRVLRKKRRIMKNLACPTTEDRRRLQEAQDDLLRVKQDTRMRRNFIAEVSGDGFYWTGLKPDVTQHALMMPTLIRHLRFHASLASLETTLHYSFKDRSLLALALTHTSFRDCFGTNPDHFHNTLSNCGPKTSEIQATRRTASGVTGRTPGIVRLVRGMSETWPSAPSSNNERLELLGDAVLQLLITDRLFRLLPDHSEGELTERRTALVENANLGVRAQLAGLHKYILIIHTREVIEGLKTSKTLADCLEAIVGAVYMDGGFKAADKVVAHLLFEEEYRQVWLASPRDVPVQAEEPLGDRHYIQTYPQLRTLLDFEEAAGIKFRHIRLLAQAFADGTLTESFLSSGSGERLELLGDAVLELLVTDILYRTRPAHTEGQLTMLRVPLVNNDTLARVYRDLGLEKYVLSAAGAVPVRKRCADFVESLIGALYLDRGMEYCACFVSCTLMSYLPDIVAQQKWHDPKSKLQHCCLALRSLCEEGPPEVPYYRVIDTKGPSNERTYTAGVWWRCERLGTGVGHTILAAEEAAATGALTNRTDLFPFVDEDGRMFANVRSTNRTTRKEASAQKKRVHSPISREPSGSSEICGHSCTAIGLTPIERETKYPTSENVNLQVDDKSGDTDRSVSYECDENGIEVTSLLEDMLRLKRQFIADNKFDELMMKNMEE